MLWFRLYSEGPNDFSNPKVQMLPEVDQRRLVMLWVLQSKGVLQELTRTEIANFLRISMKKLEKTLKNLEEKRFINCANGKVEIIDWDLMQYKTDSSLKRTREYRRRTTHIAGDSTSYLKHRKEVFERYGHKCVYCGSEQNLCIDHLVPIVLGGDHYIDNLVVACKKCNSGKAGRLPEQAGYSFSNQLAKKKYEEIKQRYVTVTKPICDGHINGPDTDTDTEKKKKNTQKTIEGIEAAPDSGKEKRMKHETRIRKYFEQYWKHEPKKVDKNRARYAFMKVFPLGLSAEQMKLRMNNFEAHFSLRIQEAERMINERGNLNMMKYPATWMNAQDFDEFPETGEQEMVIEEVEGDDS